MAVNGLLRATSWIAANLPSDFLDQSRRLHRIDISGFSPNSFLIEAFTGSRAIDQLGHYDIIVLSPDANLDLETLLSCQMRINSTLSNGNQRQRTGYIQSAEHLSSDGALTRYHFRMVPGCWYLTQNSHNRVFNQKSTLDIVSLLLTEGGEKVAFTIQPNAHDHEPASLPLERRNQYQQSNWAFIQSLLSDAGLSTVVIEGNPQNNNDSDEVGVAALHQVIIFRESPQLPFIDSESNVGNGAQTSSKQVSYATSTIMNVDDSLHSLSTDTQISIEKLTVRADSNGQATVYEGTAEHSLDLHTTTTRPPALMIAPPSRVHSNEQAQQLAELALTSLQCSSMSLNSYGTVRYLQSGFRFELINSAVSGSNLRSNAVNGAASAPELLVHSHYELGIEPVPSSSMDQLTKRIGSLSQWMLPLLPKVLQSPAHLKMAQQRGFVHYSVFIPAQVAWRAMPQCLQPASTHATLTQGLQVARTVDAGGATGNGSQGHGSFVDEQGRIHIKYPWASSSPSDDNVQPPVRTLQRQHGSNQGLQLLPRLNQDSLIGYLYDDIDSPYIHMGLYNGIGAGDQDADALNQTTQTKSASLNPNQGNSPLWHGNGASSNIGNDDQHNGALSGIVSHSIDGQQRSQLMLDDTDEHNALLLSQSKLNSNTATQIWHRPDHRLELGQLLHRVDNHRDAKRGQGFDLDSIHGQMLTAAKGLALVSYSIKNDDSEHQAAFDRNAASTLLKQQQTTAKALSDTLSGHKRNSTQAHPLVDQNQQSIQQQMLAQSKQQDATPSDKAMTLLNGRAGLTSGSHHHSLIAPKQHIQSGGSQQWNSNQLKLHSNKIDLTGGLNTSGEIYLGANGTYQAYQAHDGNLLVDSQLQLQIGSQAQKVEINASKTIELSTSGGASITIGPKGVEFKCPGTLTVKTTAKGHKAGAKLGMVMPIFPIATLAPEEQLPTLESTYAHEQLMALALMYEPETFASTIAPIFGFDIPDSLYHQLQQDLIAGKITPPIHKIAPGLINGHLAGFNKQDKHIHVAADVINNANSNETYKDKLYVILLEEYGHFIDDLLRNSGMYKLPKSFNEYLIKRGDTLSAIATRFKTSVDELASLNSIADPNVIYIGDLLKVNAEGKVLAEDADSDEGSVFAFHIAQLTEGHARGTDSIEYSFAKVTSKRFTGELKISTVSGKAAADRYASFTDQMNDAKDVQYEYFGDGEGEFENDHKILANRGKIDPKTGKYVKKDKNKGKRLSHGHQSIEKEALSTENNPNGIFKPHIVDAIYAGNWFRDHSQFIVPFILNMEIKVNKITIKPSRKMITKLIGLMAYDHFFDEKTIEDLKKIPTKELPSDKALVRMRKKLLKELQKGDFENTPEKQQKIIKGLALIAYDNDATLAHRLLKLMFSSRGQQELGVYRYEEHIDNPYGGKDERAADKDFNSAPSAKQSQINSNTKSAQWNLQNHISDATPTNSKDSPFPSALEYMVSQLKKSMEKSTIADDPLRYLGNAFHVLEDFYSHTNFTEVSLMKVGYRDTRHWVVTRQKITDYRQVPIVSGTFDMWDTFASVGPKLADLINPIHELTEYKGFVSGERTLPEQAMDIIIRESGQKNLIQNWNIYLQLRDELCAGYEDSKIDLLLQARRLQAFLKQARTIMGWWYPLIKFLLKWIATFASGHAHDIVTTKQNIFQEYTGNNPSHTQVGKDHHDNSLQLLASQLAIEAVHEVGGKWRDYQKSPTELNKQAVLDTATSFFQHPARTNRMDNLIKDWAKKNPSQIKDAANGALGVLDDSKRTVSDVGESITEMSRNIDQQRRKVSKQINSTLEELGNNINSAVKDLFY